MTLAEANAAFAAFKKDGTVFDFVEVCKVSEAVAVEIFNDYDLVSQFDDFDLKQVIEHYGADKQFQEQSHEDLVKVQFFSNLEMAVCLIESRHEGWAERVLSSKGPDVGAGASDADDIFSAARRAMATGDNDYANYLHINRGNSEFIQALFTRDDAHDLRDGLIKATRQSSDAAKTLLESTTIIMMLLLRYKMPGVIKIIDGAQLEATDKQKCKARLAMVMAQLPRAPSASAAAGRSEKIEKARAEPLPLKFAELIYQNRYDKSFKQAFFHDAALVRKLSQSIMLNPLAAKTILSSANLMSDIEKAGISVSELVEKHSGNQDFSALFDLYPHMNSYKQFVSQQRSGAGAGAASALFATNPDLQRARVDRTNLKAADELIRDEVDIYNLADPAKTFADKDTMSATRCLGLITRQLQKLESDDPKREIFINVIAILRDHEALQYYNDNFSASRPSPASR